MIRELLCLLVGGFFGYVIGVNKDMVVINEARQDPMWAERRYY